MANAHACASAFESTSHSTQSALDINDTLCIFFKFCFLIDLSLLYKQFVTNRNYY